MSIPADGLDERHDHPLAGEDQAFSRAVRRARSSRRSWLHASPWPSAAVGLVSMLLVFKLRTLPVVSDPYNYVLAGLTFPEKTWNMIGLTRYGVIMPEIPVTRLFHNSELSYYLTPILATGVLIAATHWLAARFFGQVAALVTSALMLLNTVVLAGATRLYPDVFAASVTTLALALAVSSRDRWKKARRPDGAVLVLLALTGTAVGLSWTMRETAVFSWPAIAAVLLWRKGPPVKLAVGLPAAFALAVLALEMVISQLAFGDAFARFHSLLGTNLTAIANPSDLAYLHQSRLTYASMIPRTMAAQPDGYWMMFMSIVALVGGAVFRRNVGLFAAWFLVVALGYVAFGGLWHPGAPNIRLDLPRYWLGFLPALNIAFVGTLTMTTRRVYRQTIGQRGAVPREWRFVGVVALIGVLLAAPFITTVRWVRSTPSFVVTNHGVMSDFRNWMHAHDRSVSTVFTDYASARQLPVYLSSFAGHRMAHARVVALGGARTPGPGDYVVRFSARDLTCPVCQQYQTAWANGHPHFTRGWDRVWRSSHGTIEIYRVP